LAGLEEVVRAVKTAPAPEPEPAFWDNFNRELHLKLAQSVPAPAPSRFFRMPYYLVGAPALAVLLLWVAFGYLKPDQPVLAPVPQVAKQEKALEQMAPPPQVAKQEKALEKMAPTPQAAAPVPEATGSVVLVTKNGQELSPDDDPDTLLGDLDTTLAGMSEKEKEDFLKQVRQHEKDGSCIRKSSTIFSA
jgi:hypothetical protein